MGKKWVLMVFFSLFAVANSVSQQLSHQVLVSAAGVYSSKGTAYSQTIGEAVIEIIHDFDHVLTQGFQQPRLKITLGEKPQGTGVKTYPNPAIDYVTVELFGDTPRDFRIMIYNISGNILITDEASYDGSYWDKRSIPVSGLAVGFYIIRVVSSDKQVNRSFKMEKL
jgi:hypothetical protein